MARPWVETVELTEQQRLVQESIRDILSDFGDEYWREKDIEGEYPHEFLETLIDHGWLGVIIPEEYGGAGMETPEAIVMMEEISAAGAPANAIHGAVYTSRPVVRHANQEMKDWLLPKLASGEKMIQSMALTEPNAGSESTAIDTFAERNGDEYIINGQKIWISRVDVTDYILLIARTTPADQVEKRTRGLSMFLVDKQEALDDGSLSMESIPKSVASGVKSFELWFDDLRIPCDNLVGEEGRGFYQLLDGLNEERLIVAAENVGVGEAALEKAVTYAKERVVFERPIGQNQAIQHPLAEAYIDLQAAKNMIHNAAPIIDLAEGNDHRAGTMANSAKYLACNACFNAADTAVQTHGGFGVAKEYDVERLFRNARLTRIAPVSEEMMLNYIGENVLGLPRSY